MINLHIIDYINLASEVIGGEYRGKTGYNVWSTYSHDIIAYKLR